MKHICQTCNISPGTLYHHFSSKEALIQAIIFEAQERALIRFGEPLNGISLIDYLIESTQSLVDEDCSERALVVEIMAEGMRNQQVAEMLKKKYTIIAASIIERFNDAQANNEIRDTVNKEIAARLLMALSYGIMSDNQSQEYVQHKDYPATLRSMLAGLL
jgi:TetR/AcrR family transcriptional repressor of uid operon